MGLRERPLPYIPGQSILQMAMYDGNACRMAKHDVCLLLRMQNACMLLLPWIARGAWRGHAATSSECTQRAGRQYQEVAQTTTRIISAIIALLIRLGFILLLNSCISFLFLVLLRLKKKKPSFDTLTKKSINKQ